MEHARAHQSTEPAAEVLRAVGWALVLAGFLDIGLMAYCITHDMSYSSPLNIFALAAGLLLLRQSLRTAKVVAWMAAFYLALFGGLLLTGLPRLLAEVSLQDLFLLELSWIGAVFAF